MRGKSFAILLGTTLLGFGTGRGAFAEDRGNDRGNAKEAAGKDRTVAEDRSMENTYPPGAAERVIENRFAHDTELKDNSIHVFVMRDTATLKGTVDSEEEKARAARLAMTDTVRRVDNQLEVRSSSAEAAVSDSALTAQIKTRLIAEWGLKANDLHVDTNNGVVTLTGVVADPAIRDRAIELARSNAGVKRVDDQLRLQLAPQEILK